MLSSTPTSLTMAVTLSTVSISKPEMVAIDGVEGWWWEGDDGCWVVHPDSNSKALRPGRGRVLMTAVRDEVHLVVLDGGGCIPSASPPEDRDIDGARLVLCEELEHLVAILAGTQVALVDASGPDGPVLES